MDEPELSEKSDWRGRGDSQSRYPISAWVQILVELLYLLVALFLAAAALIHVGIEITRGGEESRTILFLIRYPEQRQLLLFLVVAIAGICGGTSFALKWHYHSVAKDLWHRDRIIWRIVVPILSGVLAVFLGFMIVSGLVPFLNQRSFTNFYIALGFGFFVGYFSDNVLAALHRLAKRTFGTVDEPPADKG